MKVVIQRCEKANVSVDKKIVGSINYGMVALVGFTNGDNSDKIDYMIDKIINLRIFDDGNGIMNRSLLDINGELLSISQFTLYGDALKGRRPSYSNALESSKARVLYEEFNNKLKTKNIKLATGIFQANMKVNLINDGPVTIIIEK